MVRTNDGGPRWERVSDEIDTPAERADADSIDDAETAVGQETVPEIEEGRYLYCLVRAKSEAARTSEHSESAHTSEHSLETFETTGVEDEPVSIVTEGDVGAVVHACDELYDSADLTALRRWLVRHQTVVDEAGETFGTPIPFQFDTILRGDDRSVREWLREEYETIDRALGELAGHWEYRVEVVETEPISDEALIEHDERLADLATEIDDADSGTAFLLEKKFDTRIAELRAGRREALTADLQSRLTAHTREVHTLERSPTASLSDEVTGDDGDGETLCRLTLLAHEDDEETIGSVLDDVAAIDGLKIRFTGPWPPYTFAPTFGDDTDESTQP